MSYASAEARQELLDSIAEAAGGIGAALAAMGDAYELLDERAADRLESELFGPTQTAYGRARQTHSAFAARHGLPQHTFDAPGGPGAPSRGVLAFLDDAMSSVEQADAILTELQDSMAPVEVGDPELRAGLAEVRTLIDGVTARAGDFVRTIGR